MPAPSRVAARCWIHTWRPQQTSCQHSAWFPHGANWENRINSYSIKLK